MGLTHVAVKVRNRDSQDTFIGNFLVDTGATDSMIPACELKRIGVQPSSKSLMNSRTAKSTGMKWRGLSYR